MQNCIIFNPFFFFFSSLKELLLKRPASLSTATPSAQCQVHDTTCTRSMFPKSSLEGSPGCGDINTVTTSLIKTGGCYLPLIATPPSPRLPGQEGSSRSIPPAARGSEAKHWTWNTDGISCTKSFSHQKGISQQSHYYLSSDPRYQGSPLRNGVIILSLCESLCRNRTKQ